MRTELTAKFIENLKPKVKAFDVMDSVTHRFGVRVFTGDTLLIRGTGRTDFQNGDPRQQYNSIFRLVDPPDLCLSRLRRAPQSDQAALGFDCLFNSSMTPQFPTTVLSGLTIIMWRGNQFA